MCATYVCEVPTLVTVTSGRPDPGGCGGPGPSARARAPVPAAGPRASSAREEATAGCCGRTWPSPGSVKGHPTLDPSLRRRAWCRRRPKAGSWTRCAQALPPPQPSPSEQRRRCRSACAPIDSRLRSEALPRRAWPSSRPRSHPCRGLRFRSRARRRERAAEASPASAPPRHPPPRAPPAWLGRSSVFKHCSSAPSTSAWRVVHTRAVGRRSHGGASGAVRVSTACTWYKRRER